MKPAKSKRRYILSYIFVALIFTWVGALLFHDTTKPKIEPPIVSHKDTIISPSKQDPTLLGYLKEIKATYTSDLDIKYIDKYTGNDRRGEYTEAYDSNILNDDTKPNKSPASITILSGRDINDTKRTLAHEYMHHIWYTQISKSEQDILSNKLIRLYSKDQGLQQRMDSVNNGFLLLPTELLSYYCTDSSDSYLTPDILTTCNKYIDRSALVMLR